MLILIGVVPTAYALNRALPDTEMQPFLTNATHAAVVLDRYGESRSVADSRESVGSYRRTRTPNPDLVPALARLTRDIQSQVAQYGSLRRLPAEAVQNVRNDMHLSAEALRRLSKEPSFTVSKPDGAVLKKYVTSPDASHPVHQLASARRCGIHLKTVSCVSTSIKRGLRESVD